MLISSICQRGDHDWLLSAPHPTPPPSPKLVRVGRLEQEGREQLQTTARKFRFICHQDCFKRYYYDFKCKPLI